MLESDAGSTSAVVDELLDGVPKPICSAGDESSGPSFERQPGREEAMAWRSMRTASVPDRPVAPFDNCAAMATLPEPKSCETTAPKLMVSVDEEAPPPLPAEAVTATARLCTTAFLSGLTSSLGEPLIEPPPVNTP